MYMLSTKTLHIQNARLSLFLSEELEKYGILDLQDPMEKSSVPVTGNRGVYI